MYWSGEEEEGHGRTGWRDERHGRREGKNYERNEVIESLEEELE